MWSRVSLAWSRLLLRWTRRRWPRMPLFVSGRAVGGLRPSRPSRPAWSRRTVLNVAGSILSVVVAFAAVLLALLVDKGGRSTLATSTSPPPSTSPTSDSTVYIPPLPTNFNSDFPGLAGVGSSNSATSSLTTSPTATDTTATSTTASLTVDAARQAIVAYVNAVNARNRIQAGALICQSLLPAWLQNVDSPNSDFNFTISQARFVASSPLGGGALYLRYTLEFNDNTSNAVDFTVIEESGPKICGEQRA